MIELRDYEEADKERLVLLANNKRVSKYLIYTFPYPYTNDDAEYWISRGSKEQGKTTKVICLNGLFVGTVGITPQFGWKAHCAEIGFWIGEEYWGKGIATRALTIMTDEAFKVHKHKKLFATVLGQNKPSMRVLEKCGYKLEGVFEKEVTKDNEYHDIHHYARLCI